MDHNVRLAHQLECVGRRMRQVEARTAQFAHRINRPRTGTADYKRPLATAQQFGDHVPPDESARAGDGDFHRHDRSRLSEQRMPIDFTPVTLPPTLERL